MDNNRSDDDAIWNGFDDTPPEGHDDFDTHNDAAVAPYQPRDIRLVVTKSLKDKADEKEAKKLESEVTEVLKMGRKARHEYYTEVLKSGGQQAVDKLIGEVKKQRSKSNEIEM